MAPRRPQRLQVQSEDSEPDESATDTDPEAEDAGVRSPVIRLEDTFGEEEPDDSYNDDSDDEVTNLLPIPAGERHATSSEEEEGEDEDHDDDLLQAVAGGVERRRHEGRGTGSHIAARQQAFIQQQFGKDRNQRQPLRQRTATGGDEAVAYASSKTGPAGSTPSGKGKGRPKSAAGSGKGAGGGASSSKGGGGGGGGGGGVGGGSETSVILVEQVEEIKTPRYMGDNYVGYLGLMPDTLLDARDRKQPSVLPLSTPPVQHRVLREREAARIAGEARRGGAADQQAGGGGGVGGSDAIARTAADVMFEDGAFSWLQLPSQLPLRQADLLKDRPAQPPVDLHNHSTSKHVGEDPTSSTPVSLAPPSDYPSTIGELVRYRSGKVVMKIGQVEFLMRPGPVVEHQQHLVSVGHGTLDVVAPLHDYFIAVPDLEQCLTAYVKAKSHRDFSASGDTAV